MTTATRATTTRTISERLADYVVDLRYEDIPSSVVQKAKDHLVNHIGIAFRGHGSSRGQQAVELAIELSGAGGNCAIVGERRRADLLEAVLANSFLMGGGRDDAHPSGVHPGVIVQPVAWAVGEACGVSGRELLTAVIAGYDVMAKLHAPVCMWEVDPPRVPNHVVGPLGGAATAARLLGLSREQATHALGHAGQAGMGIYEGIVGQDLIHPLLARNGVMAAMLAKAGMPASRTIIEGRHGLYRSFFFRDVPAALEASLARLGQEFEISNAITKPYRASSSNIVPIDLMMGLTNAHALQLNRIAAIEVTVPEERLERESVREAALRSQSADSFCRAGSLRFQLAVVAADGGRNEARFDEPPDADLLAVLDRVRLRFETDRPFRYARIEVATTDGQQYIAEGETYVPPPGDWAAWLVEGGRVLLAEDQLTRLVELIGHLEDVPDVAEVMAATLPKPSS